METITLQRDGEADLVFDGEQLSFVSSRRGPQTRWLELGIYRTSTGTYLVAGCGRSEVKVGDPAFDPRTGRYAPSPVDEVDRHWIMICRTPEQVIRALTRVDENNIEYITKTSRDALAAASERDAALRDAFLNKVA